jgi:uncharacterized membrane protein YGL010W
MRSIDSYLDEYAESHQNPVNVKIHNVCVPAIMWSVLGFLHTFPLTENLRVSHLVAFAALVYYGFFGRPRISIAMSVLVILMVLSFSIVPELRWVSVAVFVAAWVGQFYGHRVEGKKPSFFKDLLFLLIGPVWVVEKWFGKLSRLTYFGKNAG